MFRSPEAKTPTKTNQKSARERLLSRTSRVVTVGSLALAGMVGLGSHISAEASTPAVRNEKTPQNLAALNKVELERNQGIARRIYGLYEKYKLHPAANVTESLVHQYGQYYVDVNDQAKNGSSYDLQIATKTLGNFSLNNVNGVYVNVYYKTPPKPTDLLSPVYVAASYQTYTQPDNALSLNVSYDIGRNRYFYFDGTSLGVGIDAGINPFASNGRTISQYDAHINITSAENPLVYSDLFGALNRISRDVASNPPLNVDNARVDPPIGPGYFK